MSRKNDSNTKKEVQAQDQMCITFISPIAENNHYPCLFTRRYNKSKKKYQYYLYTPDEDFLFAVAAPEEEFLFSISMNANDISSPRWAAGSLRCTAANQFTGISFKQASKETEFQNSIRIDINESQKLVQVKIAPPDQPKFIFVDGNSDYKALSFTQTKDPNISQDPKHFNLGLEYNGKLCFSLVQEHADEFRTQSGHPFSLFQTFCLCVAIVSTLV